MLLFHSEQETECLDSLDDQLVKGPKSLSEIVEVEMPQCLAIFAKGSPRCLASFQANSDRIPGIIPQIPMCHAYLYPAKRGSTQGRLTSSRKQRRGIEEEGTGAKIPAKLQLLCQKSP